MSPQTLVSRLESLQRLLDEEGWHVHSNSVSLAIEAISPKPRNKSRHRPGYFKEYMRAYRARKKLEKAAKSGVDTQSTL